VHEFLGQPETAWLMIPFPSDVPGLPTDVLPPRLSAFECEGPLVELAEFHDVEFFISPADLRWTFVRTHEDYGLGGPYFVRAEWIVPPTTDAAATDGETGAPAAVGHGRPPASNLYPARVAALLFELIAEVGLDLEPAEERRRLELDPPPDVDAFTDAVLFAEFKGRAVRPALRAQVRARVLKHFLDARPDGSP
jgi:hypothetical protein